MDAPSRYTHGDRASERLRMVELQLEGRGIRDRRVLAAMAAVPRERFVPPESQHLAYSDGALAIGHGQTISQPYMVAHSCELAALTPQARVLEVGAGSGYQAAVLAQLSARVTAIELLEPLAIQARATLAALHIDNVEVICGDGSIGYAPHAPYDAILVAAGAPHAPPALLSQLADGGRLVIPVGTPELQWLTRVTRRAGRFESETHEACVFVPLLGAQGVSPPSNG